MKEELSKEAIEFFQKYEARGEEVRKQIERLNETFERAKPMYENQKIKERIGEYFEFIMNHGKNINIIIEEYQAIEIIEDCEPIAQLNTTAKFKIEKILYTPSEEQDILVVELSDKSNVNGTLGKYGFGTFEEWEEFTDLSEKETLELLKTNFHLKEFSDKINLNFFSEECELYQFTHQPISREEKIQSFCFDSISERNGFDNSTGYIREVKEKECNVEFDLKPTFFKSSIFFDEPNFITQLIIEGDFLPEIFLDPVNHKFLKKILL